MPSRRVAQSYTSGQLVPHTGLYLALDPSSAVSYGKLAFDKGEPFPQCSRCDNVHYRLLRVLPSHVFHSKHA